MLLAIDVGNTQTVIGLYGEGARSHELADHWRVATKAERTSDEHALLIQEFLSFSGHDWRTAIAGVAICSGVPMVTYELRRMCVRYLDIEPVVLGTGTKTGMPSSPASRSALTHCSGGPPPCDASSWSSPDRSLARQRSSRCSPA
jgi:type III pantothenate kinase